MVQSAGVASRFVGTNRHGDVTELLDASQLNPLVGSQIFDPFGQALSAPVTSVGFQGDWTDPTSKQPWMAARWYQPKTGTFTNRDTLLGSVGGATVGHNRYTYAANNPMTYWDPTGHDEVPPFERTGGLGGLAVVTIPGVFGLDG
jgi:RHS repeat-associated protein